MSCGLRTWWQQRKLRRELLALDVGSVEQRARLETRVLARVTNVYDGDTITVAARLTPKEPIFSYKVRVSGLDTPEIKPPRSTGDRKLHVQAGKLVRDVVQALVEGTVVQLEVGGSGKYGRLLGTIYTTEQRDMGHWGRVPRGTNLNAWLLSHGLALQYEGGTKSEWTAPDFREMIAKCRLMLGKPATL